MPKAAASYFQPDLFGTPVPPSPSPAPAAAAAPPKRVAPAPKPSMPPQQRAPAHSSGEEGITEESRAHLQELLAHLTHGQCRAQRILSSYPLHIQVDILTARTPRPPEFQAAIEADWADPQVPATRRHPIDPP